MDGDNTIPPSISIEHMVIPVAGILIIIIVFFVSGVIVLLCIRKLLQNRGIDPEVWPSCRCCDNCCTLPPFCLDLAERLDCNTPDTKVLLDNICPSQQQCSVFWGKVFSCYCCYSITDSCKGLQLCPNGGGSFTCPTCTCPCNCECECTMPQCEEINCICFKIKL